MRIALVADEDPGWGGIGTYTGVLGTALTELGHDVQLVLRGWEQDGVEKLDGLTVHRVTVPEPSWRRGTVVLASRFHVARESLLFSARVARVLDRIRPDVVEAPEFHAATLVPALRLRLGAGGPPVVVRLHTPAYMTAELAAEPRDLDLRTEEVLEALNAQLATSVSSPAAAMAGAVGRRWRLAAGKVRVVPNPIDDGIFSPAGEDDEEKGSILVVGRVERNKGQDILVEALPSIRAAVPDARLRIVGADGGLAEALSLRAQSLGVLGAVSIEGPQPRERLPAVYRSAAICAVPSRFENFPYTALEAMACGRPVVAARVGGLPEVIADRRDGVLVEPENPAALAAEITRLLLDVSERRRLGEAARERVLCAYAASEVAARTVDHYAEVIR